MLIGDLARLRSKRSRLPRFGGTVARLWSFANTRLILQIGTQQATSASLQYSRGALVMQAPPWDVVSPRFCFAGFYGKTGFGEAALGNDVNYEGVYIEIADVKTALKVGGAGAFAAPNGGHVWTDANNLVIPANAKYRILWAANVPLNGFYPGTGVMKMRTSEWATASGRGDFSGFSSTSLLAATIADTTGSSSIPSAVTGGPIMMVSAGVNPSTLCVGDSIGAGQNQAGSAYAARPEDLGAMGFLNIGLNLSTGGRRGWANLCIPGTRFTDLTLSGGTESGTAQAGFAMRKAALDAVDAPFDTVLCEMGTNSIGMTGLNAFANSVWTGFKNWWPGRRVVQTTMTPATTAADQATGTANNLEWTSQDASKQKLIGDSLPGTPFTTYIRTTPAPLDGYVDVRAAAEPTPGSSVWAASAFTGTLVSAAAVGNSSVVIATSDATDLVRGTGLLFEPGSASLKESRLATTVTNNGDGTYTVGIQFNMSKAHDAGTIVKVQPTNDGIHPSDLPTRRIAPAIAAAKAAGTI